MPLLHMRFEFSCFRVQVFIVYVGFFPQVACFFDKGERVDNKHAEQSVVGSQLRKARFERVKGYRTEWLSIPPLYSLRRICAHCLVCKIS
jgi:hypothetical protein